MQANFANLGAQDTVCNFISEKLFISFQCIHVELSKDILVFTISASEQCIGNYHKNFT